jgi:hypothetical protein
MVNKNPVMEIHSVLGQVDSAVWTIIDDDSSPHHPACSSGVEFLSFRRKKKLKLLKNKSLSAGAEWPKLG